MANRELRILVGAAIDPSFGTVMASVVEQTKRARKQIQSEVTASSRAMANAQKQASNETKQALQSEVKTAKQISDVMIKEVSKSAKERVRLEKAANKEVEADLRSHNAERARQARENAKIFKEAARDQERSERSALKQQREDSRDRRRNNSVMMRVAAGAIGAGTRLAGSMIRGIGVDTSLTSQMQGSTHREQLAVNLANQGYIGSGKGPAGSEIPLDPRGLQTEARELGNKTGTATETILEGMEKFTTMTGDLQTARDVMGDIGKIAKANGADFGDMMEAAANISISMGAVPEKGKHLAAIMRTVAGQGHLGAVVIRDMADQMGKLTAQANFFKIDPRLQKVLESVGVNNPTTANIAIMGAMAQYARAKGGRITSQQATQSSMAFIRDLANPSEVKRMHQAGIEVYADQGHSKVRDPMQVMLEVFKKAQVKGGLNRDVINKVFGNKQSRAVAEAMSQDYNNEYAKAGMSGVTDETKKHQIAMEKLTENFEEYLKVTQSTTEVEKKFKDAMNTSTSQANIMNNEIGHVADEIVRNLLPAVLALAPAFIEMATSFMAWVAKISGNETGAQDAASAGLEMKAVALTNRYKTGPTKDFKTTYEAEGNTQKDLENEIKKRQGTLAEKGSEVFGLGKNVGGYSDKELEEIAGGKRFTGMLGTATEKTKAKDYLAEKKAIERLEKELSDLNKASRDAWMAYDKALRNGPAIRVEITNLPPPGADPVTTGVAPPDSSSHGP